MKITITAGQGCRVKKTNGSAPERGDAQRGLAITPLSGGISMVAEHPIVRQVRTPLYESHPMNLRVPRPNGSLLGDVWINPQVSQTWSCGHDGCAWPGHTVLYELHDETRDEDVYRYIGITNDIFRRFGQHRADKPWWPQVTMAMLTCYVNRETALSAELSLIQVCDPPFNTQGRVR